MYKQIYQKPAHFICPSSFSVLIVLEIHSNLGSWLDDSKQPISPLAAAVPNSDLLWPLITCHCLLLHRGRMIPEELEKLIIRHKSEGHLPFFVNCTTGTTVYGAYDPIEPIADICEKYGIWLHIDVSKSHKRVLVFLKSHSNQHNTYNYNT